MKIIHIVCKLIAKIHQLTAEDQDNQGSFWLPKT